MITPEANAVWAGTGAIVSPHKGVGTDAYPNELVVREAESLTSAAQIRYDGADLLPAGIAGESLGAAAPAGHPRRHHRLGRLPDAREGRLGRRVTAVAT